MWDIWNAKLARTKADDALVADETVLEALKAMSTHDGTRTTFPMGPLALEFHPFAAVRFNEHAFQV